MTGKNSPQKSISGQMNVHFAPGSSFAHIRPISGIPAAAARKNRGKQGKTRAGTMMQDENSLAPLVPQESDEEDEAAIQAQLLVEDIAANQSPPVVMDAAALALLESIAQESAQHPHPFFSKPKSRTVKQRRTRAKPMNAAHSGTDNRI